MLSDVEIKPEVDLEPPSAELLEWAKTNIREDPDTRCQQIEEFRDLIFSRGQCSPHRTDDEFLLRFLRSRKFSLEAAHYLFVNYYEFREANPHFVEGANFRLLEKIGKSDVASCPPYRDQIGRRIVLYKLGKWSPQLCSIDEIVGATILLGELAVLEPKTQILGGIVIIDCEGITMQQAMNMTPAVAYKIFQVAVNTQPLRLEAVHIVNSSWIFETAFNMFRPLLHSRMKEKLYFHGNDMDSLHKYVDPKCLPEKYGGMQPEYDNKDWIDNLCKKQIVIDEIRRQGYAVS